jgi:hypothetical protein
MARSKAQKAQKTLTETAEGVRDTVVPAAQDAAASVASAVGPALADAKDKVGPALVDAKDKITPILEEAKDAIVPAAQAALEAAKDKSHDVAVNTGLVEEKKSHKLRNFLIVLGLGGAIAFAYKKLSGKEADPVWTQSRDQAAAPRPTSAAAGPVDGSDTAPTAPLASEETVESPVPSTPDAPIEERNV